MTAAIAAMAGKPNRSRTMPLPTRAKAAPRVPKKTCQATTLTLSREVTAISGRRDSKGPPERVLNRWKASSIRKK